MRLLFRVVCELVYGGCAVLGAIVISILFYEYYLGHSLPAAQKSALSELTDLLGCSGDPCVIRNNTGGSIADFNKILHRTGPDAVKNFIVDGYCASACAYLADKARPRICITKKAVFQFHKARTVGRYPVYLDPIHSTDIQSWVTKRGGYPYDVTLDMHYAQARKFWRTCTADEISKIKPAH